MSALPPIADIQAVGLRCPLCAISDIRTAANDLYSITSSARASRLGGTVEAERPRRFEVDHQLELVGSMHRQVFRMRAAQDAIDITPRRVDIGLPDRRRKAASPPSATSKSEGIDRGHAMTCGYVVHDSHDGSASRHRRLQTRPTFGMREKASMAFSTSARRTGPDRDQVPHRMTTRCRSALDRSTSPVGPYSGTAEHKSDYLGIGRDLLEQLPAFPRGPVLESREASDIVATA